MASHASLSLRSGLSRIMRQSFQEARDNDAKTALRASRASAGACSTGAGTAATPASMLDRTAAAGGAAPDDRGGALLDETAPGQAASIARTSAALPGAPQYLSGAQRLAVLPARPDLREANLEGAVSSAKVDPGRPAVQGGELLAEGEILEGEIGTGSEGGAKAGKQVEKQGEHGQVAHDAISRLPSLRIHALDHGRIRSWMRIGEGQQGAKLT